MRNSLNVIFVFLFLSLLIVKPTPSYAWHGHGRTYVGVNLGLWPGGYYGLIITVPYYGPYYGDPYYPGYVVASPSPTYQPVVVNGVTYYVNNGAYYIYTAYGYQAVTPPVVASQPVVTPGTVTVSAPVPWLLTQKILLPLTSLMTREDIPLSFSKNQGKDLWGPKGSFILNFLKFLS